MLSKKKEKKPGSNPSLLLQCLGSKTNLKDKLYIDSFSTPLQYTFLCCSASEVDNVCPSSGVKARASSRAIASS